MIEDIRRAIEALENVRSIMGVQARNWPYRETLTMLNNQIETAYLAVSRVSATLSQTGMRIREDDDA